MTISRQRQQVPIVSLVERRTKGRKMSLAAYMDWKPEDSFKYEWNDGILEQRPIIKPEEFSIVRNLKRALHSTEAFGNGGDLYTEFGCRTSPTQVRVPDVSFYTAEEIDVAARKEIVPQFVVEIISPNDAGERAHLKVHEYLRAGVRVVWQVYPQLRQVWVFHAITDVTVCSDDMLCSAAPALPDLRVTPNELFAKRFV
jgi:Uma2 family endonuclease